MNFFNFPVRIAYGPASFGELPGLVKGLSEYVLVVCGQSSMRSSRRFDELLKSLAGLGVKYTLYEGVTPDPTVKDIDNAAAKLKEGSFDLVLAVGGGSVLDFGKSLALMKNYEGASVWDFVNTAERRATPVEHEVLPLIAVPTTSGTGSEATPFTVLTNKEARLKKGIGNSGLYPVLSVLDPELTLGLPREQTLYTALDAFCQSLESYIGIKNSPLTEYLCLRSITGVITGLPGALDDPGDIKARSSLSLAAMLSGMAIGHTDVGLAHAIGQAISISYPLPHGLLVALVTPSVLEFSRSAIGEKIERVEAEIKKQTSATDVRGFFELTGLKLGLANYGVKAADLGEMIETALLIGSVKTSPVPVDKKGVRGIIERAMDG
ncbi:hypothetical protein MNBD_DELTA01-346 [hydrothermal vent metagenome]|uniref:Uncharacterized protein n=1 Tax=hydrothermal vent metagenome TaxID=652676 RepID=A0A3B0QZ37_9ZZZZ